VNRPARSAILDPRSLRAAGAVALLSALVGVAGGVSLPLAVGLPVAGVAIALIVRSRPGPVAPEYGLLPALVGTGAVAALAAPSFLVGALAGSAGLALLLWNAESPRDVVRGSDPFAGLLVPGLCLLVALLAAVALPSGRAAVGVAGVTIIVAFAIVVWALGEAWRTPEVPAKAI
jgi:hypothetical protein